MKLFYKMRYMISYGIFFSGKPSDWITLMIINSSESSRKPFLLSQPRSGFILGLVFLSLILAAVFIFSYNSIVRHENLKAHHEKISSITESLARSGVLLLNHKIETDSQTIMNQYIQVLKTKTAQELGGAVDFTQLRPLVDKIRDDFNRFLTACNELAYKENGIEKYPFCNGMKIGFADIKRLSPGPADRGHDPREKYGSLILECEIEYRGLIRKATLTKDFRVISMVPGPFARFSLFLSQTPFQFSYNAMGVDLLGKAVENYQHPLLPTGNTPHARKPLVVINGPETTSLGEVVSNNIQESEEDDKKHLLNRGWIFIGPTPGSTPEAVYLNIPTGIEDVTSGLFMFGWPINGKLVQLKIEDDINFKSSNGSGLNYCLAQTNYGFYANISETNLWPGFEGDARLRSASTWLYPFGNRNSLSRTLIVGNVLAGFLKLNMLKDNDSDYKIVFKHFTQDEYNGFITATATDKITMLGMHDPAHAMAEAYDAVKISEFFKTGYDGLKMLAPYNSTHISNQTTTNPGVSFNAIFDYMKYNRTSFPDPRDPSLAKSAYDADKIRVPAASRMRTAPDNGGINGVLPHDQFGIYFKEGAPYDCLSSPDNCYFYGNLTKIRFNENNSNIFERVTETIRLEEAADPAEETRIVEKFLFSPEKIPELGGEEANVPRKSGIFHIIRKQGLSASLNDAIIISTKKIYVSRPFIVLISNGSVNLTKDIVAKKVNQSPEMLASILLSYGDFYLSGHEVSKEQRKIDAYLAALGNEDSSDRVGRLLSSGKVTSFEINGGLALKHMGLFPESDKNAETTINHFPDGGTIRYNPGFNPSLPSYADAYEMAVESGAAQIIVTGGAI